MPFCTMLLADMGARVIKVELARARPRARLARGAAPPRRRGGARAGRAVPRPQQARRHPRPQDGGGRPALPRAGAARRRGERELQRGHDGAPRAGLRGAARSEPGPRVRLDHRLRPDRALRAPARLRHAGAGDQRLHEHHRRSGRAADPLRPVDLRLLRRACSARSASSPRSTTGGGPGAASASTWLCSTAWWWRSTTSASATRWAARSSSRAGNVSFAGSATGIYPAADGHVAVAASASNAIWARFCAVIGRDELTRDPGFATAAARRDRRDEIAAIIQALDRPARRRRRSSASSRPRASPPRRSTTWPRWWRTRRCRRARCSCGASTPSTAGSSRPGPAQALGDAGPRPLARAHARRAQRGRLRGPARPLEGRPRALARRRRDLEPRARPRLSGSGRSPPCRSAARPRAS